MVSVGEGAGDAVRLGEGLDRGSKGNSTSKRCRDGAARRTCMWQEVPERWPALEGTGTPTGMLVLSLPSTSLSTSVFVHLSNGVKNSSLWQTE